MEYSLKTLKDEMKMNNFNFKKMFGQNFIIDENITNRIVELADIDKYRQLLSGKNIIREDFDELNNHYVITYE